MFDVETYAIIKKRIASGIGGSTSGSAINDTEISEDTMLSSQKIVDTVCPPFSVSGPIVQCTPVENYELGVKVNITPVQEGEGDPSPENVRPIVGWDAVNITRCGKNLLDMSDAYVNGYNLTGFKNMLKPGMQYTYTVKSSGGITFRLFAVTKANTPWGDGQLPLTTSYIKEGKSETFTAPSNIQDFAYIALAGGTDGIGSVFPNVEFQLELGSASTSYEPYRGQTYTIPLGQTVYGGTLDVGTEDSERTVDVISLAVADMDNSESFPGWQNQSWITDYVENINQDSLFAVAADYLASNADGNKKLRFNSNFTVYFVASALGYTQSQIKEQYPNLVFQFAFRRITPEPFHYTSTQQILALSGTNTLDADAGDITVTGVSDPGAAIATLQDRLTALENNTLN